MSISFHKSDDNSFDLIKISKEYKYVSDLPKSVTSQFDNCYIDKTLTGCGFTTWVLQNDESYIVAVPFKGLIDCKVSQSKADKEMYPHEILPFYCNASETDLNQSLKGYVQRNKVKKIMVTYDSVPKLISYLEHLTIDMKNFKLFIDEAHKILEFAGNFKANVISNLEQTYPKFKTIIAATATPTRYEYIPYSFSSFNKIKLDWELKASVTIKHKNISQNEVRSAVQAFAYSHLNGDLEGNAYFFINSVKFAIAITQSLIKVGFDKKHFNIICGKSNSNDKLLKPLKLNNYNPLHEFCKINFITSTAFEGQDFMDPDGVTYVLSTGKLEHTKIDISTQLPQINGRLRCSKYKNKVNFIWSYAFTEGETNFNVYEAKTIEKDLEATASVPMFHTLTNMLKTFVIVGSQGDIWFLNDKNDRDELIKNPNAKNHLLNAFVGTQLQYFVHCADTDGFSYNELLELTNEYVEYTLNDILGNKVESNLEVPELSASIKLKLNKVPNFSKLVKEYAEATIRMKMSTHGTDEWYAAASIVNSIRENGAYDDVVKYIETFGAEEALSKGDSTICNVRVKERLEKSSNNALIKDAIEKEFTVDDIIYIKDIKDKLQEAFDKHGIDATPKRAQLSLAFEVKPSTYTDTETGIRYNVVKLYPKQ